MRFFGKKPYRLITILTFNLMLIPSILLSAPLSPKDVPPPLQPWINWVLQESLQQGCPFYYDQQPQEESSRICQWPSQLVIEVNSTEARFEQDWYVYGSGWVALPGDSKNWPQNVIANEGTGQQQPVMDREGVPSVFLRGQEVSDWMESESVEPNEQSNFGFPQWITFAGQFRWEQRPEYLTIPPQTGLVKLILDGMPVATPDLDEEGRLWLRQHGTHSEQEAAEENRLDLRVYRRIVDEIPLQIVTRMELDVAGRPREEVLGPVTLNNGVPMSLESPLPSRLEPDGRLRVQVQPGSWVITLQTRQAGPTNRLDLALATGTWVPEEVWCFEAHNELRWAEVTGIAAIDPQQTTLPQEWRQFPAYLVKAGDALEFTERRRGDPEPAPDQLNLSRYLWLDFDGRGYSVQDRIHGKMTQGWRLEMVKPAVLGRVNVNGEDQFITRLQDSANAGVEVRRGQIDLVADSRLEQALLDLPAVGWDHDFQSAEVILNLPPGWELLNVQGADNVPNTWFKQWTLLDLFIVLIIALTVGKLWRWWWGLLALLTLVLISHEANAPYLVWLSILAATALLRVLPTLNQFNRMVRLYRDISLVTLIVLVIPFMIQQIRQSLYVQLERPWARIGTEADLSAYTPQRLPQPTPSVNIDENVGKLAIVPLTEKLEESGEAQTQNEYSPQQEQTDIKQAPEKMLDKEDVREEAWDSGEDYEFSISSGRMKKSKGKQALRQVAQIDPNAQVQTGPGLPQWQWQQVSINWSGPVKSNQTLKVWLISPPLNRILGVARAGLLAGLTAFLLWVSWRGRGGLLPKSTALTASSLLALVLGGFLYSSAGYATPVDELASPVTAFESPVQEMVIPEESPQQNQLMVTEFPDPELLNELRDRLLAPPDCVPHCASSPRMFLELTPAYLQIRMEIHADSSVAVPLPGQADEWLTQGVWVDNEVSFWVEDLPSADDSQHELSESGYQGLHRDSKGQLWLQLDPGKNEVELIGPVPARQSFQLSLTPLKPHFVEVHAEGWRVDGLHENGIADDQLQFTRESAEKEASAELEMGSLPPFVQVERTLLLGLDWQVETRVTRLTPTGTAAVLEIPLLPGESVTSEEIRVNNGKALINLAPQQRAISWLSVFTKQDAIQLTAAETTSHSEVWRANISAIWHIEMEGIPVIHHQDQSGRWLPEWRPWPGESVTLHLNRLSGVLGQVLTIDRSQLSVSPGQRTTDSTLSLLLRSSRGSQHTVTLPANAELQTVNIDTVSQPIRQEGANVTLPVNPGAHRVELMFRQPVGMSERFSTPALGLGIDSVNTHIKLKVPQDRWILFVDSSPMGPAVMIWGILIVLVVVAIGLGRVPLTPLTTWQWLLLLVVLSQVPVMSALIVVGWLMFLGLRARLPADLSAFRFNVIQISLVLLTVLALIILFKAVRQGLLGYPNMHIAGNDSGSHLLRWYEDRTTGTLPQVWMISISVWIYQVLMLFWALWLAFALLRWLQWGWQCFSTQGLWKPLGWWQVRVKTSQ